MYKTKKCEGGVIMLGILFDMVQELALALITLYLILMVMINMLVKFIIDWTSKIVVRFARKLKSSLTYVEANKERKGLSIR